MSIRVYQCAFCDTCSSSEEWMLRHVCGVHPHESVDAVVREVLEEALEIAELNRIWRLSV